MNPLQKPIHRFYRLAKGVHAREERFGLLFYNSKGSTLTFVHSGSWIRPEFFLGQVHLKQWVQSQFATMSREKLLEVEESLDRVLSKLEERGLIVEISASL